MTGRSQVLPGGTSDGDAYEMVGKRGGGVEKGITTIVGRSRKEAGESEEDILKGGAGGSGNGSDKDQVYVTRTVEVYRGV